MKRDYVVLAFLVITIVGFAAMWAFSYWPFISAWIAFAVYCFGGFGLFWLAVCANHEAKATRAKLDDINRQLDQKRSVL